MLGHQLSLLGIPVPTTPISKLTISVLSSLKSQGCTMFIINGVTLLFEHHDSLL